MAGVQYRLVHDALLYVDADGNPVELNDAERDKVYDAKDLPKEAVERGVETGALVKVGSKEDEAAAEDAAGGSPPDES
jgi:hypothetical protein